MRTSSEMKQMAKKALQGNYGTAAGAILVIYLMEFLLMFPLMIVVIAVSMFFDSGSQTWAMTASIIFVMIVVVAVGIILMVGYTRICYRIVIGDGGQLGDLWFAVKNHFFRYLGFMLIAALVYLAVGFLSIALTAVFQKTGGSMVLISMLVGFPVNMVLTAVIICRFSMAFFALVENPEMTAGEAMRLGKELIQGNLWRMIKLELSFFGIFLLGQLTVGIGFIWILPYVICTNIIFYLTVKDEKYPPVYKSMEEETLEQRFNQAMPELPQYRL